ncbi:hypothetical protein EDEG_00780 [Edhazardia aedis USNM 41457]|uniref:Exocyst complex component Sec8 N-terminal domain-containing protein n=1 Tax=Edhazardia aedis (strain USNM 41457) TaxID=1003232 RepID=J8ZZS1_EDHAE|nr:hypothetical protein EDEG_00780 [Edhazardia aedis USNM 41457]|eukprot:EJW05133.1 hypothetical protein EDEG_00780 [Edhazardia aedis USNM 41457]
MDNLDNVIREIRLEYEGILSDSFNPLIHSLILSSNSTQSSSTFNNLYHKVNDVLMQVIEFTFQGFSDSIFTYKKIQNINIRCIDDLKKIMFFIKQIKISFSTDLSKVHFLKTERDITRNMLELLKKIYKLVSFIKYDDFDNLIEHTQNICRTFGLYNTLKYLKIVKPLIDEINYKKSEVVEQISINICKYIFFDEGNTNILKCCFILRSLDLVDKRVSELSRRFFRSGMLNNIKQIHKFESEIRNSNIVNKFTSNLIFTEKPLKEIESEYRSSDKSLFMADTKTFYNDFYNNVQKKTKEEDFYTQKTNLCAEIRQDTREISNMKNNSSDFFSHSVNASFPSNISDTKHIKRDWTHICSTNLFCDDLCDFETKNSSEKTSIDRQCMKNNFNDENYIFSSTKKCEQYIFARKIAVYFKKTKNNFDNIIKKINYYKKKQSEDKNFFEIDLDKTMFFKDIVFYTILKEELYNILNVAKSDFGLSDEFCLDNFVENIDYSRLFAENSIERCFSKMIKCVTNNDGNFLKPENYNEKNHKYKSLTGNKDRLINKIPIKNVYLSEVNENATFLKNISSSLFVDIDFNFVYLLYDNIIFILKKDLKNFLRCNFFPNYCQKLCLKLNKIFDESCFLQTRNLNLNVLTKLIEIIKNNEIYKDDFGYDICIVIMEKTLAEFSKNFIKIFKSKLINDIFNLPETKKTFQALNNSASVYFENIEGYESCVRTEAETHNSMDLTGNYKKGNNTMKYVGSLDIIDFNNDDVKEKNQKREELNEENEKKIDKNKPKNDIESDEIVYNENQYKELLHNNFTYSDDIWDIYDKIIFSRQIELSDILNSPHQYLVATSFTNTIIYIEKYFKLWTKKILKSDDSNTLIHLIDKLYKLSKKSQFFLEIQLATDIIYYFDVFFRKKGFLSVSNCFDEVIKLMVSAQKYRIMTHKLCRKFSKTIKNYIFFNIKHISIKDLNELEVFIEYLKTFNEILLNFAKVSDIGFEDAITFFCDVRENKCNDDMKLYLRNKICN